MNSLTQIRCFLRVAELQSFSKAAQQLHISTTAVSKQIKNLEDQIEEQLFVRTTRHVRLTEFGEHLYQRCKVVQDEVISINQFIESKKQVPHGKLKVLVSTILAEEFVLKYLAEYLETFPEVELELIFSEQDIDLTREDIDIMVGFPVMQNITDLFKFKKMFDVKNILCASPKYIKKYGKPKKAEDLLDAKFISHSLRKPGTMLPLDDGQFLPCAKPLLFMDNFDALNQACLDGIGIFLTGDKLVEQKLKQKKLIRILPQYDFRHYEIFIFYHVYHFELPKIRSFIDFYLGKI